MLDEIGTLANRLRKQAALGSVDTLNLARAVNEYQCKIRSTNAKIMACVGELSLYRVGHARHPLGGMLGPVANCRAVVLKQALAGKLSKEKEQLEEEVLRARRRLASGEAPSLEVQKEWENMQRTQEIISKLALEKADIEDLLERQSSEVEATADPRPNAYIPEDHSRRPWNTQALWHSCTFQAL